MQLRKRTGFRIPGTSATDFPNEAEHWEVEHEEHFSNRPGFYAYLGTCF